MTRGKDNKEKQQLLADFLDLGERIIENLFQCGQVEGAKELKEGLPPLSDFGWMVIHRCQLSFTNVILGLLYLIRLKQRHPSCKGAYGSGHRLFLASLIVANKYLYDDAYHNHTWAEVSQGAFQLDEVNRMEFELVYFLNFSLGVTRDQWHELVDLLDAKLHTELLNVGCLDSQRYRLTQQCGLDEKPEAQEEGTEHPAVSAKEKMNQLAGINAHTPSPLQDARLKKPTSITNFTPPSSACSVASSTTLGSLSTSLHKGSMLKHVVHRRASLATDGVYPTSRTSRPLPQVPERSRSNSISHHHPLLMALPKDVPIAQSTHPRRKSLPAIPISTRTSAHVNFHLDS